MTKVNNKQKIVLLVTAVLAIFGQKVILDDVETLGVWEGLLSSVVLFFLFPFFIIKGVFKKDAKMLHLGSYCNVSKYILVFFEALAFIFLIFFAIKSLGWFDYVKLNYLAGREFYFGSLAVVLLLDLIFLPIIIFSQEFFFRGFVLRITEKTAGLFSALVFQAALFAFYEGLFLGGFSFPFLLISFIFAFFLGFITFQTRNLWFSFFLRWIIILLVDGYLIFIIQTINQ